MANQAELVCEAIKARLQTIIEGEMPVGGGAYENTPEVYRQLVYAEGWAPQEGKNCQFFVSPLDPETSKFGPSSCEITTELQIAVLMCKRTTQATESPASGAASERWQMQNSMAADLKQAIFFDPKFGNTTRMLVGNSIEIFHLRDIPSWAVAEARFTVIYATDRPGR